MGQRLTDRVVASLPLPPKGNIVIYDTADSKGRDWVPGFGIRLSIGQRSYVYNYRANGRARRLTIGSPPVWTAAAARAEAKELAARVERGSDPLADRQALRSAETVSQLIDTYIDNHVTGTRSERDTRSILKEIGKELGGNKVAAIKRLDMQRLHRKVTQRGSPYRANRLLAVASAMFNLAVEQEWCVANPCKGITRNPEQPRERCLEPDELTRFMAVLDHYPDQDIVNRFLLALFTGARIGEVSKAKWTEFNADLTKWTKPWGRTKQKKNHTIPLNGAARALLWRIRSNSSTDTVFRPLDYSWLRRHFAEIAKAAKISDLRIHDLRRSFGSTLINLEVPLTQISKLLGHSKTSITERVYAHLRHDVLAEASELAGAALSKPTAPKSDVIIPQTPGN
jgi:integrase